VNPSLLAVWAKAFCAHNIFDYFCTSLALPGPAVRPAPERAAPGVSPVTRNQELDDPAVRKEDDAFNRWPFSKRLADTIAGFDTSGGAPVIGIYGKWGSGKTSVLNFLQSAVEEHHAGKTVLHPFNPWLFKDHETLLQRFFTELFKAMEKSGKSAGERIGQALQDYSGLFGLLPGFGAGATLAQQTGKALTKSMEQVRDEVGDMMKMADKKVVVLIDDLDRLGRDKILQMLKVVRLTANFPNVVYLLAFDDEMVARTIEQKYGGEQHAGRQFLEKIVQYPFTLPAVSRDRLMEFVEQQARSACAHAGLEPGEDDWREFTAMADDCLARRLTTPRQAIRYGNALRFGCP
jgi:predicted KAP-like P-loop ATPase